MSPWLVLVNLLFEVGAPDALHPKRPKLTES
jgi:hypothetical protein